MNSLKILAFDFGTKKIGLSIGQSITKTAQPLQQIKARDGIPNWHEIKKIIDEWQPDELLVGAPFNMDGSDQLVTHQAKKFANRLHEKFKLKIHFYDERLSTAEAKELLFEQGGYQALQKNDVDSVAACLILESWFTHNTE